MADFICLYSVVTILSLILLNSLYLFHFAHFSHIHSLDLFYISALLFLLFLTIFVSFLAPLFCFVFHELSLHGGSDGKESTCNAGDPGSIPGSERSPWRRKWQPAPVFLPRESHGQRSLEGYSSWGHKSQTQLSKTTYPFLRHIFSSLFFFSSFLSIFVCLSVSPSVSLSHNNIWQFLCHGFPPFTLVCKFVS